MICLTNTINLHQIVSQSNLLMVINDHYHVLSKLRFGMQFMLMHTLMLQNVLLNYQSSKSVVNMFTHHDFIEYRQAVITPSALSMIYPKAEIPGYSLEQFLNDLTNECEKDIRLCFQSGAHCVQLDFTEARFSLKVDPSGQLLRDFVQLNNRVLDRFGLSDQCRLGVHVCAGLYSFIFFFLIVSFSKVENFIDQSSMKYVVVFYTIFDIIEHIKKCLVKSRKLTQ